MGEKDRVRDAIGALAKEVHDAGACIPMECLICRANPHITAYVQFGERRVQFNSKEMAVLKAGGIVDRGDGNQYSLIIPKEPKIENKTLDEHQGLDDVEHSKVLVRLEMIRAEFIRLDHDLRWAGMILDLDEFPALAEILDPKEA